MFREMKMKHKMLSEEACINILKSQDTGVLSVIGDNGYPYGVPLNYVYQNNCIYLHGARKGHKISSIMKESKACFTIITQNEIVAKKFSTNYRSIIIFGKTRILKDEKEKKIVLMALVKHISSNFIKEGEEVIEKLCNGTSIIEFAIEHMTGKANKED